MGDGINSGLNRTVAIAGINNFVRLSLQYRGIVNENGRIVLPELETRSQKRETSYELPAAGGEVL